MVSAVQWAEGTASAGPHCGPDGSLRRARDRAWLTVYGPTPRDIILWVSREGIGHKFGSDIGQMSNLPATVVPPHSSRDRPDTMSWSDLAQTSNLCWMQRGCTWDSLGCRPASAGGD